MKNKDWYTILMSGTLVLLSVGAFLTSLTWFLQEHSGIEELKMDYCTLFKKYDEYFTMIDNPYNMIDRTAEYSRYFYFKDEFLKYCK